MPSLQRVDCQFQDGEALLHGEGSFCRIGQRCQSELDSESILVNEQLLLALLDKQCLVFVDVLLGGVGARCRALESDRVVLGVAQWWPQAAVR